MLDFGLILVLLIGGFIAGFYSSGVGGGGLIVFPLLLFSGLPTVIAIGTMKLVGTFLTLFSAARFRVEKKLNLKTGIFLGVFGGIGALIGSVIVINVDEAILNLVIAIVFVLAAVIFLFEEQVRKKINVKKPNLLITGVAVLLIGIYGGFFGVGFGTILLLILVFSGFSFIRGAALGGVIGFMLSVTAFLVFAFNNLVNFEIGIILGIGTAAGAWIGAGVAVKKGDPYIKFLAIFIVLLSVAKLVNDVFRFF